MSRPDKFAYIFDMLPKIAARSHDAKKVGCAIVGPDDEIRSVGYNGFPRGLDDSKTERLVNPEKVAWLEHAERNAIYNAARVGIPLKGSTLYCSFLPCPQCARAIVQVGIQRVIVDRASHEQFLDERWAEEFKRSLAMFDECRVELVWWNGRNR